MSGLSPSHHYQPHRLSHSHLVTTAGDSNASSGGRTLGDYEREIMELRTAMETLQMKLGEAERKLEERNKRRKRDASADEQFDDEEEEEKEERVKEAVNRLALEEDRLRREQVAPAPSATSERRVSPFSSSDRERMILMQQRKVSSLDAANARLGEELGRMEQQQQEGGGVMRVAVVPSQHQNLQQDAPRTVDELLDSLHSTPI